MKKMKKIAEALGLVLAALAVAALCTWIAADDSDEAKIARSLEGAVSEESEHEEPRGIDWDSLSQEIVAWVEVPNTSISQPVVKADKQNPNAYLFLDALGKAATAPPYIDADCTEGSLLVPIYGHNMSDGGVFSDFAKYSDESFARGHSRIDLYTRDGRSYNLSVIAVDVVDARYETMCPSFGDAGSGCETGREERRCPAQIRRRKQGIRVHDLLLSGGQFPSHRVCGAESMR